MVQVNVQVMVQVKAQMKAQGKERVLAPRVVAAAGRSARRTRAVAYMPRVRARAAAQRRRECHRVTALRWVLRPARRPAG